MPETVLVVRHGPGRGRIAGYGDHILDWLRAARPDLAARIRVHETGTGPAALDDVRAVFFWLADPLKVKYPACYEEATTIQDAAQSRNLRMLNRPTALADYGKETQANRFRAASIPTPQAIRIEGVSDLAGCADRLGLPLLVRGSLSFGQEGTFIVRNLREIGSLKADALPEHAIVTSLVDVRGPRTGSRADALWTRYYHRKRVLLIGDTCVPYSLFFARTPVVTQHASLYHEYYTWQKRLRERGWLGKRALRILRRSSGVGRALELETEFTDSPVDHEEVFRGAGAALGLEFLAFDFASLPDGDIVIWEANPYPYMPPVKHSMLSHTRDTATKIGRTYDAFERCFEALLEASPRPG